MHRMELQLNFSHFSAYVHYLEQSPDLLTKYHDFLISESPNVKIQNEFSKPELLGIFSLFLNWIQPLFPASFFQLTGLEKMVPPLDPENLTKCVHSLGVDLAPPGRSEGISIVWEKLLNCFRHPKISGTYFTPPKIAELMAGLLNQGEKLRVIDPSCGAGILLVSYLQRFPPTKRIEILRNVFGWDINPLSVFITRLLLLLEVLNPLTSHEFTRIWSVLKQNITCCDALEVENLPRGFDAAILNPPYLRIEMLKERKHELENFHLIHRRLDSYLLFLELCLRLIKEGGEVVCIVPDKVLTESNGKLLRQKLLEENLLRKVIDCRDSAIFRGIATVHPVILHLRSQGAQEAIEMYSALVQNSGSYALNRHDSVPVSLFKTFPSARIDPQLTTERVRVLDKIYERSFPLKEIAYISYGAQPGIKDNFVFESLDLPPGETSLKWLLRGRDIKKFVVETPRYVIRYVPELLHRPAFPQLFQSPRVVVQKVTGRQGLIAAVVPSGVEYYTDDSVINIITLNNLSSIPRAFQKHRGLRFLADDNASIPVGKHWWMEITKSYTRGAIIREKLYDFYKEFSPAVLCAVINSQVVAFFFNLLLAGGMNVFPEHVRWLPITPDLRNHTSEITDQMASLGDINEEALNEIMFKVYKLNAGEISTIKSFLEH